MKMVCPETASKIDHFWFDLKIRFGLKIVEHTQREVLEFSMTENEFIIKTIQ